VSPPSEDQDKVWVTFFDAPEMFPRTKAGWDAAFAVLADEDWHNHATGLKESTVRVTLAQARSRKILLVENRPNRWHSCRFWYKRRVFY
jgi:hypothetical protein